MEQLDGDDELEQKIREGVQDPKALKKQINSMLKDTNMIASGHAAIRSNPTMHAKALNSANDKNNRKAVSNISKKKQMAIYKASQTKAVQGIEKTNTSVSILKSTKNEIRMTKLPTPEEIEGWISCDLSTGITITYNPQCKSKNKIATNLAGKRIGGDVYVYKILEDGFITHVTDDEIKNILSTK